MSITVDAEKFAARFAAVAVVASKDRHQPMLGAVHVKGDGEGKLTFQATDRYRLVAATMTYEGPAFEVLIPAKAAADVKRVKPLQEAALTVDEETATLKGTDKDFRPFAFTWPVVDAQYPDLSSLFPRGVVKGCDADGVNPVYMADFAKVWKAAGFKNTSVSLWKVDAENAGVEPFMVTFGVDWIIGLLMPVRGTAGISSDDVLTSIYG